MEDKLKLLEEENKRLRAALETARHYIRNAETWSDSDTATFLKRIDAALASTPLTNIEKTDD